MCRESQAVEVEQPSCYQSSYVPGVTFPETHPLVQCGHREFTPIYDNVLTHPVDQPLSLQPLQQQPWPGRQVPEAWPWVFLLPAFCYHHSLWLDAICPHKPSVSILVQDSTTILPHGPGFSYSTERKHFLHKKEHSKTQVWLFFFSKSNPDFKEAMTRAIANLVRNHKNHGFS